MTFRTTVAFIVGVGLHATLITACGAEPHVDRDFVDVDPATPQASDSSSALLASDSLQHEKFGNAPLATTRDSAGVRTVEYAGGLSDLPIAFQISERILVDIGGQKGRPDEELGPSGDHPVAQLSDGRIVVGDSHALKLFDAQGAFLRLFGRVGQGPGEFQRIRQVCAAEGDTIVAIDDGPRALVFDASGTHLRTFRVRGVSLAYQGCFADGSIFALDSTSVDPFYPEYQNAVVTRVSSAGAELGRIGLMPRGSSSMFVPALANFAPHAERIYVGDGRSPEIHVYSRSGSLQQIIRWSETAPLSDELLRRLAAATVPTTVRDYEERVASAVSRARAGRNRWMLPAYLSVMVDAAGRIWVQDYYLGRGIVGKNPSPWTVFAATGEPIGRVVLPKSFDLVEPRWIGSDRIALRWRDSELGFVHMTYHELKAVR